MDLIKLLLVDDHKIIRDGIKSLLNTSPEVEIVGEASNGLEAYEMYKENPVDVVIMDIKMPEMNGIDSTTKITKEFPNAKILALTMHDEEGFISKMLHAGAMGYLLKNTGREELLVAIKKIVKGENYFSIDVATKMMSRFMNKKTEDEETSEDTVVYSGDVQLTKREIEVIKLIAEGFTSQDIAEKLFISPRTVDTHRRNLLQKLNVKNTAELIKFAIKHQLL